MKPKIKNEPKSLEKVVEEMGYMSYCMLRELQGKKAVKNFRNAKKFEERYLSELN